jgi:pimeloyl-ACP methyl ester carboxylesterase
MKPHSFLCAALCFLSFASVAAGNSALCQASAAREAVSTSRTTLAGVPAVLRIPREIKQPPIILWHGFGPPDSEDALMTALPLDEVPAVKVYLGLPLFGARTPADEAESIAKRQAEDYATRLFEPAVLGAAKELPAVVKALEQNRCIEGNDKVALFGFSAGGAAVLYTLAERNVKVRSAVTVNAPTGLRAGIEALERVTKRPYAWTPASRRIADISDAVARADEIARANPPPALLLFHGADDTVITPDGAVKLEAALRPLYKRANAEDRLELTLAPGVAHDWTRPQTLAELRKALAEWFITR